MNRIFLPILLLLPGISPAAPITYSIQDGSAPSFSASWLHAATSQMGDSGYYTNGNKARIAGDLTIDWSDGDASGSLTTIEPADTNFGLGDDAGIEGWVLDIVSGSLIGGPFVGGDSLLIALTYNLSNGGLPSTPGTFYFANKDFNGGVSSDGPNYADSSVLYLWGNNWVNTNGASDRDAFVTSGGTPLGIDLYGVARVPEPGTLFILSTGLLGLVFSRRKSWS